MDINRSLSTRPGERVNPWEQRRIKRGDPSVMERYKHQTGIDKIIANIPDVHNKFRSLVGEKMDALEKVAEERTAEGDIDYTASELAKYFSEEGIKTLVAKRILIQKTKLKYSIDPDMWQSLFWDQPEMADIRESVETKLKNKGK